MPENTVRFKQSEWLLLHSALNQVIHDRSIDDHKSLFGMKREELEEFVNHLHMLPRDAVVDLYANWVVAFREMLRVVLQRLGYGEFQTRTGYSIEEAQAVLKRLNQLTAASYDRSDSEVFLSEWLGSQPAAERPRYLALISWALTNAARKYQVSSEARKESDQTKKLVGLSEIQGKIASQIASYLKDEATAYPLGAFCSLLFDIAAQYHITALLETAIEPAKPKSGGLREAFRKLSRTGG